MFLKAKQKRCFLSFGENCLTLDILRRFSLYSYSTPYSSARSNIEYILFLEKNQYNDFLNREHLSYEDAYGMKVVRLNVGKELHNCYDSAHMKGFEFTHQDVISNEKHREQIQRRCQRLLDLKGESITIFYYHRMCKKTNWEKLLEDLNELRQIYLNRGVKEVDVVCFTQSIVKNARDRKMCHYDLNGIHVYVFHTLNVWAGTDKEIFWARVDNDLLKKMIKQVKRGYRSFLNLNFKNNQDQLVYKSIDELLDLHY